MGAQTSCVWLQNTIKKVRTKSPKPCDQQNLKTIIKARLFVRSAQRVALREITVDTLVSTLTRRGRH